MSFGYQAVGQCKSFAASKYWARGRKMRDQAGEMNKDEI